MAVRLAAGFKETGAKGRMWLEDNIVRRAAERLKWSLVGTITHVSTSEPVAALTFDDGPNPEFTPCLLSMLERFQASATFFMIGEAARKYPHLVERVARAGHAVGNHSWDHPSFPRIGICEQWKQLRATEHALSPHGQKLFRPPFGHQTVKSRLLTWHLGYQVVTWNVVAMDWLDKDPGWMADRVLRQIQPGSIVLFHDSLYPVIERRYSDRGPTLRAVELLLKQLGKRFRFVTVPQLLTHGRPQMTNWWHKGKAAFITQLRESDGSRWRYVMSGAGRLSRSGEKL